MVYKCATNEDQVDERMVYQHCSVMRDTLRPSLYTTSQLVINLNIAPSIHENNDGDTVTSTVRVTPSTQVSKYNGLILDYLSTRSVVNWTIMRLNCILKSIIS